MNGNAGKKSPVVAWIIHFAFMMTIPVYAVVATFVLAPQMNKTGFAPEQARMYLLLLSGVAAVSLIMGLTAPGWLMKAYTSQKKYQNQEGTAAGYLEREIVKIVVIDAFLESVAVYGLVGLFLGFKLWQSYIFMGVSFLVLLLRIAAVRNVTDTYYQLKGSEEIG